MRRLAALVLAAVLLSAGPAQAIFSVLGLKNSMVQFLLDQLSTEGVFEITAEEVDEPEDGVTAIRGLKIADGEGVWFSAERLNFSWSPSRLLLGEVEFSELSMSGVRVDRQPVTPPSEEPETTEETDEPSFDWPRSPLALKIERLALDDVKLAEPVLGHALGFDAEGAAQDEGDIQSARLNVTRNDAVEGTISFDYARDFSDNTLKVNLEAAEAPDGLIANLADLPREAPSSLTLNADGPPTDWRMTLDLAVAEMIALSGDAQISYEGPLRVDADFRARPGERLDREIAGLLGTEARLVAKAAEGDDGLILIEEGKLEAPDVDLVATGSYSRTTGAADLAVQMVARAGLAEPFDGVAFEGFAFVGTVKGPPGAIAADGDLELRRLATAPVDVAEATLAIDVRQSGPEDAVTTKLDIAGATRGLRLDKLGADVLGPADIALVAALTGNALSLDKAALESAVLQISANGDLDLESQDADFQFDLSTPDLAPVAEPYGVEATGKIRADGQLTQVAGVLDLVAQASLNDFSHPQADAKALTIDAVVHREGETTEFRVDGNGDGLRLDKLGPDVLGPSDIEIAGRLTGSALALEKAALESAILQVSADGTADIETQDADLRFELATPDMTPIAAPYGVEVEGAIDADGHLQQTAGVLDLVAQAGLSDFLHPQADADALTLDAVVHREGETTDFRIEGAGEGLRIDRIGPELIGTADLDIDGTLSGDDLTLRKARLVSRLVDVNADGTLDLADQTGSIGYLLTLPILGEVAAAFDTPLAGNLAAQGTARLTQSVPRVIGALTIEDLNWQGDDHGTVAFEHDVTAGDAQEGRITLTARDGLYGPATVSTGFSLAESVLTLSDLDAEGLGLAATGEATVDLETTLANASLAVTSGNLKPLSGLAGAALGGQLNGTVSLAHDEGRQNAEARLSGSGLRMDDLSVGSLKIRADVADALGTPAVNAALDAGSLGTGDVLLETVGVTARGPITAVDLQARLAGAVGDKPISAETAARADLEGPDLGAVIRQLTAGYAEEQITLRRPLRITARDGVVSARGIDLGLPDDGTFVGDVTSYGQALSGDIRLEMPDLSLARRLADVPVLSGRLSTAAKFDTRPGRERADASFSAGDLTFDDVDAVGALGMDAEVSWNGRTADIVGALSGDFGDPVQIRAGLPVRRGAGPLPVLATRGPVSAEIDWRGDIGQLWSLVPATGHVLEGDTVIDLSVSGDISAPEFGGGMRLENGGYQNLDLGTILTDLALNTELRPGGELGFELNGRDGGRGQLTVDGAVALDASGIDISTEIDQAVLVRRDDAKARIDGEIKIGGPVSALQVDGDIRIEEAEIRLINSSAPSVADLGDVRIKGEPEPEDEEGSSSVTLAIDISATDDVFVRGRGLDSEWKMSLAVRGDAAAPRINGRIERVRGQLDLLGKAFELTRGRVDFDGGKEIDPRIDIALERETSDLTGRIIVEGHASEPELSFTSSPSLPEDEIMPRVLFGKSSQALSATQAVQLALGLATLMDGSGGTLDAVRGAVGLDTLAVDQDEDGNASIKAGKEVSEGVFVGTKQNLGTNETSVVVEIEVFDEVSVDAEVGQSSDSSVGLNWKRDF